VLPKWKLILANDLDIREDRKGAGQPLRKNNRQSTEVLCLALRRYRWSLGLFERSVTVRSLSLCSTTFSKSRGTAAVITLRRTNEQDRFTIHGVAERIQAHSFYGPGKAIDTSIRIGSASSTGGKPEAPAQEKANQFSLLRSGPNMLVLGVTLESKDHKDHCDPLKRVFRSVPRVILQKGASTREATRPTFTCCKSCCTETITNDFRAASTRLSSYHHYHERLAPTSQTAR
jgi:hypothetical protein